MCPAARAWGDTLVHPRPHECDAGGKIHGSHESVPVAIDHARRIMQWAKHIMGGLYGPDLKTVLLYSYYLVIS